jgi:hypothetical protein
VGIFGSLYLSTIVNFPRKLGFSVEVYQHYLNSIECPL